MRKHLSVLFLASAVALSSGSAQHPRLFVTEPRIERIQAGLEDPTSHYAQAFETLRERVLSEDIHQFDATDDNWNYARSYLAQAAAFCYQVTGEPHYAEIAYRTLRAVHEDPDPDERFPESGAHGLSRATVGLGFALAYDWCYDAWDEGQRGYILERVKAGLEMWENFSHANFGSDRGSNWVAVCRGAELMMILGAGLEEQRKERYEMLQIELLRHIDGGYDSLGTSQEGIGYTGYGGIFLLPAIYAARDVGNETLWKAVSGERDWYRMAMYAGSFTQVPSAGRLAHGKVFQMSGVGGPSIGDEGWASLLLASVPEEDLPEFLWWYDRHMGRLAEPLDQPELHYDPSRQGTMWALLFYPADVVARDPTAEWAPLVTGELGRHYFRQRWQDGDDVMVAIHADTGHHSHAWAQSEAGQMSLIAYETMFFGGPRKSRDGPSYTKLLVDGKAGEASDTGRVKHLEKHARGGYVVVDGGDQYANLGVENYHRHLFIEYGPSEQNNAVITVLDRVDSYDEHTYTWNVHLGTEPGLAGWQIEAETGSSQGYPTFTLRGAEKGVVKGWVLSPADAELHVSDERLFLETRTRSTDFFVALSVEPDEPATLEILEKGLGGTVFRIGETILGYDRRKGEIVNGATAAELTVTQEQPLAVRGLEPRVLSDGAIELRWLNGEWGGTALIVEQRKRDEGPFEAIARLDPTQSRYVADELAPATGYIWRIVTKANGQNGEPSNEAEATTWHRGQAVYVEDFAPRKDGELLAKNALGQWETRNQDRGWALSNAEGSVRNAAVLEGRMETQGRTRIDNINLFFTEAFQANMSGPGAAVEIDVRTQGTTRFGLMLKMADGRWVRTASLDYIASRDQWETHRWEIAEIDEWILVDPEAISSGDPVTLSPSDLDGVHGLGIWASWPLNERWAQVDQLHLYARDLVRSSP